MNTLVLSKVWASVEFLATLLTFKWLLSSVDPLVPSELWQDSEGLPTVLALKGFLTRMNFLMLYEV